MSNPETSWKIYDSNEKAWEAMIADCKKAEKCIVLETLIFVTDDFGRRLIDVCAERAAAGVEVRFLWDAWGS
ncbi:MAG: cardiolipin synthase, partial [Candidatus Pacebacteria bacterium]|nr:cardiolipin synthase [Candidatus Paceibacterota bacterium]